MNIVLAGMPGSGKTTVAKVFAKRGRTVVDTDEEIIKKYGEITAIFEKHGEEYFRNLETQTVKEVCGLSDVLIATGGGCLLRSENVKLFKASGKIVFLRTATETLLNRIDGDTRRPLLLGDMLGRLEKLYKERTPVYENAADVIIDTDNLSPEQIADKISELVK